MSLHSRSSVDCKSLTLYTNTYWSTMLLGQARFVPRPAFHLVGGSNEKLCHSISQTRQWQWEVKVITWDSDQCQSPESGATLLQKRSIFGPLTNPFQAFKREEHFSPLKLPINKVFNAIKKMPEPNPMWPYTPRSKRILFLPWQLGHQTNHCRCLPKYLKELL